MPTHHQMSKAMSKKKKKSTSTPGLKNSPQKKGSCSQILMKTPSKPSSGKSKVASVQLTNGNVMNCHMPGIGSNLQKYSTVLVRGCRVSDMPAMKYRIIRGKYDCKSVYESVTSRSKYGKKKPKD